jgi:hypothetical protein
VEIVGYLIPTRGIASPLIKYDGKRLKTRSSYPYGTMISFKNTLKARLNCAGIASILEENTFVSMVPSPRDGI